MEKNDFIQYVHDTFQHLLDCLEEQLGDESEIEVQETSLQITLSSGKTWLLNRHAPRQEIWLSSPITGGIHFRFDPKQKKWISTRPSQDELFSMLEQELSAFSHPNAPLHLLS